MSELRLDGILTLPNGSAISVLLNPDGTFQQWGAPTETLAGTVDLVTGVAERFAELAADHRCPMCGQYVSDPEELRGGADNDHESHCDACRDFCTACITQEAAEQRFERYGRW